MAQLQGIFIPDRHLGYDDLQKVYHQDVKESTVDLKEPGDRKNKNKEDFITFLTVFFFILFFFGLFTFIFDLLYPPTNKGGFTFHESDRLYDLEKRVKYIEDIREWEADNGLRQRTPKTVQYYDAIDQRWKLRTDPVEELRMKMNTMQDEMRQLAYRTQKKEQETREPEKKKSGFFW